MTPFIQHVQNVADAPGRWPDEFLAWYKPDLWETENRAAAVFIGEKFAALLAELKGRHQRQHDAEALAGEYLMQRDDARAELERLRALVAPARAAAESLRYLGGTLHAQRLEEALAAAPTQQADLHSCHDACTRPACVEARERWAAAPGLAAPGQQAANAIIAKHFGADAAGAIKAQDVVREVLAAQQAPSLSP